MPRVRVRYFAGLRELVGVREEELLVEDGTTLAELLLKRLPEEHPDVAEELLKAFSEPGEDGRPVLGGRYLILVNGCFYARLPGGADYVLRDGDVITIFPPLGGG